ncbi:hypothetical protein DIC82_10885 [Clostridium beijerinckii]|nr:hypothetical protein DIC82_10885 [Clostridium beijerinckii]
MPNIFDGLRKISDDDLIQQIALLETINMTNISKPIAQKAKKKTISIINFFGSKLGKNHIIEESEVKEIWTLIDEKKDELKNCTRPELDEKLLNILMERFENDIEDPTEDEISVEIIEEVAKLYKLHKNLTPGQKADNIYLKYCEKLKGKAKEYLNEHQLIELKEATESIEDILLNMDEEQRKNFEHSVDVEKLSLLNAWKKMNRQLFARLIWLSVKAYGGSFTPKKEILPSFMGNKKDVEIINKEEHLKESQEILLKLKNKIELCKEKIESIENSLQEKNRLLNNAIKNKSQAEEGIINAKKMNGKLEEVKKSQEDELKELKEKIENATLQELESLMEEFKKVKFDSIDINNKISDINMDITYRNELIKEATLEIASNEKTIGDIGSEFQQFKMEANNLLKAYNEKKEEVNKKEEEKRNEIFERWIKFFDKFTFEFKNLNHVANFTIEELLHVEECLYELHFTKDPIALSMGLIDDKGNKKEEYEYIDVSFSDEFEIEIQYKVSDNEEKNVHIVEITTEL